MNGESGETKDAKLTFYLDNDIFYERPSTGGNGIYWYMVSGTLLLIAGVLILYKNKKERQGGA